MGYIIIALVILLSPAAGAGSVDTKSFTLRCTQGSDRYAVRFTAQSKDKTEFMRESMLRQGTISSLDLCVTTTNN
jgi:hypothetical protein